MPVFLCSPQTDQLAWFGVPRWAAWPKMMMMYLGDRLDPVPDLCGLDTLASGYSGGPVDSVLSDFKTKPVYFTNAACAPDGTIWISDWW